MGVNNSACFVHTSGVQVTYIWDMTNTQTLLSDMLVDAAMLYKQAPDCAKSYIKMEHLNRIHLRCIHGGMTAQQVKDIFNKVLND